MKPEDALQNMPAAIRQAEADLFKQDQAVEGLRLRLKMREADLAAEIANAAAHGDAGKKAYPNADSREAELRRRLEKDADAIGLRREMVDGERLRAGIRAELDYRRAVQQNARVLILARSPSALVFDDAEVKW